MRFYLEECNSNILSPCSGLLSFDADDDLARDLEFERDRLLDLALLGLDLDVDRERDLDRDLVLDRDLDHVRERDLDCRRNRPSCRAGESLKRGGVRLRGLSSLCTR